MNTITRRTLLITLLITITGCAQLTKQVDTIKPTAKLTSARLTNINFDQVDLVFNLAVDNKNPVALKLAGLDYDFKIENQSLVSGVSARGLDLKANATSDIELPVTLKFKDLKKLSGELWNKEKLSYQLNTTFNIKLPVIGNYAIPVSKQGEVPVPKMPKVKLKNVKLKDLGFTSADIIARVEVDNPNAFQLGMSNFNYQLKINDQDWGQGKLKTAKAIPAKSSGMIEIPLSLNLMNMGQSAYAILTGNAPLDYQLNGSMTVDTGIEMMKAINVPLDVKGSTSLNK